MSQILIIEDESVIRDAVRELLERYGHSVTEAGSLEEAEDSCNLKGFDLILADIRLPGLPGTAVIERAEGVPVLIMTSYASVRSAVDAMRMGAADYIAKPFDHEELRILVERTLKQTRQQRQQEVLKSEIEQLYPVNGMIGACPEMQTLFKRIDMVAPTEATVLVLGESGTGKELVARALHEKSRHNQAPFVAFNCASLPEQQIETALFGHEGEQISLLQKSAGGTLFLDEIGELPLAAQGRLLRILQSRENLAREGEHQDETRIIAATNRDIRQLVQEQRFRSDLYFRLRVVELNLPPLRERGNDILELARYLLAKTGQQINRPEIRLSPSALTAICHYRWPGNIRELANTLERAAILCEDGIITPDLLAIDHRIASGGKGKRQRKGEELSLEEYFRQFVLAHQDEMSETEMARRLGISRKTLWERRQRFGLTREKKST